MLDDEKILCALLACGSVATTAKQCGVTPRTIYNRLEKPVFKGEYDRRKARLLNEACNVLQATLTEAIQTVRAIMNDTQNAPQIRLNASQKLLTNALRLTEQIDVLKRLERLEASQDETD